MDHKTFEQASKILAEKQHLESILGTMITEKNYSRKSFMITTGNINSNFSAGVEKRIANVIIEQIQNEIDDLNKAFSEL